MDKIKILDLIPESLRPKLIEEIKDLLKKEPKKPKESVDDDIQKWADRNRPQTPKK